MSDPRRAAEGGDENVVGQDVADAGQGSRQQFFSRQALPNIGGAADCPARGGLHLLPRTFPADALFVGYAQCDAHDEFVGTLATRALDFDPPLRINLVVSQLDIETASIERYLEKPYSDFVTVVVTRADETLWMQDYFEAAVSMSTGRAVLIDLPYFERDGEEIPSDVALSCQLDMVPQTGFDGAAEMPGAGDYGGNVEALPGALVLVGDNATLATRRHLEKHLADEQLTVHVAWLDTGHVDEILSVVPFAGGNSPCDFALAYASPALALEVLSTNAFVAGEDALYPSGLIGEEAGVAIEEGMLATCLSHVSKSANQGMLSGGALLCERFLAANRVYERIIRRNVHRAIHRMQEKLGCAVIRTIPLPQLFIPTGEPDGDYGSPADAAMALNPNAVNNISLNHLLMLPEQPYGPFHDEIVRRLGPTGLSLEFVDSSHVHRLSGGIHCMVNVARACRGEAGTNGRSLTTAPGRPPIDCSAPATAVPAGSGP